MVPRNSRLKKKGIRQKRYIGYQKQVITGKEKPYIEDKRMIVVGLLWECFPSVSDCDSCGWASECFKWHAVSQCFSFLQQDINTGRQANQRFNARGRSSRLNPVWPASFWTLNVHSTRTEQMKRILTNLGLEEFTSQIKDDVNSQPRRFMANRKEG